MGIFSQTDQSCSIGGGGGGGGSPVYVINEHEGSGSSVYEINEHERRELKLRLYLYLRFIVLGLATEKLLLIYTLHIVLSIVFSI